jgi:glycosyltransferase involved in cell wall biosynthesis
MKVLHLNQSDLDGGAAIVSYKLHCALLKQNVESRMLVGRRKTSDEHVASLPPPRLSELLLGRLTNSLGLQYVQYRTARDLVDHPWVREADVIHLHNLHSSHINYRQLPEVIGQKPVVLTVHDMWSFTGHCGYSNDCDRYMTGCGSCPDLNVYPPVRHDLTALQWKWKKRVYGQLHMHISVYSRWIEQCVRDSMLKTYPIRLIPLGLDLNIYRPTDRAMCRSALGIESDRLVLMVAATALDDPRKGIDLLVESLRRLPEGQRSRALLLAMGSGGEKLAGMVGIPTINLGYVEGDNLKSLAYNAADVFVFPTRADVFGLVMLESVACGTPVASFRVGGVPDLVRPGITGELASPENSEELAAAIASLLENKGELRSRCREVVETEYSDRLMAERHIELYRGAMAVSS